MAKILEIDNLEVAYGGITALRGICMYVEEGEVVALIGANGAGKTTTLRAVCGMIPVQEGKVVLAGRNLCGLPSHLVSRMGVVHIPEGRGIFPNLTVAENLMVGAHGRKDRNQIKADMEKVFDIFPRLRERSKQPGGTLSGGEQQMLAVGRALMARGKVILMDEPSMGLAPVLVRSIFQVIREINRMGATILLVEQNALMALRVAHRAYVLQTGRMVLSGDAAYVRAHPDVMKAYLGG